jgi:hypothetical protein
MNLNPQHRKLLRRNIYIQVFFLLVGSIILDGGRMLVTAVLASVFFWLIFIYSGTRKSYVESRWNTFLLKWGLVVFVLVCWLGLDSTMW